MTEAADLVVRNAEVHTLTDPDETVAAVAVRDGEIVRVDTDYEVDFLAGVDTEVIDLDGRVVLPGFIDAHTHMEQFGQHLVHADLSKAGSADEAVERLRANAHDDREFVLGFGYDESEWPDGEYLTREDLDAVSEQRPVVAMRVDLHVASLNTAALEWFGDELPDGDVRKRGGDPTGVVVEDAATVVRKELQPDPEEAREVVTAARDRAHELGVTGVHELVRFSNAPRAYRDLAAAGELDLRVRINYWSDHREAAAETGLRTNHGGPFVRVGGIKTFTDGSIGGRTAKLSEPYDDVDEETGEHPTGQWVVDPEQLREVVADSHADGFQVCAHAIGDVAIERTLDVYEAVLEDDPGDGAGPTTGVKDDPRHRIEHAELATDEQFERMADAGVIACMQPNFHRWAQEGGLYDRRLGVERRRNSNRLRTALDAGVDLAFGSDCMPLDPLLGVHHAVNAPAESQRISVTEALRAYTLGAARAGFDEDRLGTIEPGKLADLVVLERSPWDHPEEIDDIDVALTIVDGEIVYDGR